MAFALGGLLLEATPSPPPSLLANSRVHRGSSFLPAYAASTGLQPKFATPSRHRVWMCPALLARRCLGITRASASRSDDLATTEASLPNWLHSFSSRGDLATLRRARRRTYSTSLSPRGPLAQRRTLRSPPESPRMSGSSAAEFLSVQTSASKAPTRPLPRSTTRDRPMTDPRPLEIVLGGAGGKAEERKGEVQQHHERLACSALD